MEQRYEYSVTSGGTFLAGYSSFRIAPGAHPPAFLYPELRIVRVLEGGGVWQIGERSVGLDAGDIVFVNNVENRRFLRTDAVSGIRADVFSFTPTAFGGNAVCFRLFYGERRKTPVRPADPGYGSVRTLLDSLYGALARTPAGEEKIALASSLIAAVTAQALVNLNALSPLSSEVPFTESAASAVSAALQYVNDNIASPFDVADLAASVYLSRGYFTELFRRYTGFTPAQFIRRARVNNAVRLLASKKRSVLEAALASGFTTSSGFYKSFGAVFGVPPTAFLRSLTSDDSLSGQLRP